MWPFSRLNWYFFQDLWLIRGFLSGTVIKNLPAHAGDARDTGSISGSGRWRRTWQPTPVFLPGKFHGQRSLVGYSPLGCKESDITEHTLITIYCNKSCLNVDSVSITIPYSPNLLPFFILSKYSLCTVALTLAVWGMTAKLVWFLFPFSHIHSYCRSNFNIWFFLIENFYLFT